MEPQFFKGDALERQMEEAGRSPFIQLSADRDDYFDGAYESAPFLLMLYDSGRMPFSDRVPRDSFVDFLRQAIPNFQVTGTFEAYLFIIKSIFGAESDIFFEVLGPGKLDMVVSSPVSTEFEMIAIEYVDGTKVESSIVTNEGFNIAFRGVSGIDSEAKLKQLLAELIPAGLYVTITLGFFNIFFFEALDGGDLFEILDHEGNQIVFFETGS